MSYKSDLCFFMFLLCQITFDYPFRIPPYFALVIRAISVLEGIALVGKNS